MWGSNDRLQVARAIEAILADSCWRESLQFHPDDPYLIVGDWKNGDLSELEALMDIEKHFGVTVPAEELKPFLAGHPTFGQFVDLIIRKRTFA